MVLKKMVRISCKGKSSVMKEKILKKTIDYSRAYRYMNMNKANVVMVALFTILILAIYITYYKEISYAFAAGAIAVLKPVFPDASLHLASTLFTQGYYLYYVDTVGAFPSLLFSWGNIVFTLLFLLFVRFKFSVLYMCVLLAGVNLLGE